MQHYLSGNASTETPSNLLFFDTESRAVHTGLTTTTLSLRLWVAIHVRLEKGLVVSEKLTHGYSNQTFWDSILPLVQPKKPLHVYAHNLGFDLTQVDVWDQMDRGTLKLNSDKVPGRKRAFRGIMAIDGNPCFMKLASERGVCWFVDTLNYWQCSLADLGNSINLPKLAIDPLSCSEDDLYEYCVRDVAIIKGAVVKLIQHWRYHDLGNWRSTAAGLSMQNYRHWCCGSDDSPLKRHEKFDILIDKESASIPLEREAYYGGRIEAFYVGQVMSKPEHSKYYSEDVKSKPCGPIYHLDVRSMYPYCMWRSYFPIKRERELTSITVKDLENIVPAKGATAEVLINSWQDTYPLRYGGRQIHASGRFWTVLCGAELNRALASSHVEDVGKCTIYRTAPIFYDWVSEWWKRRHDAERHNDFAAMSLCKLILNSLSGKFAQRPLTWKDVTDVIPQRRWGSWYYSNDDTGDSRYYRAIAGNVQLRATGDEPEHSFPAISAFITSCAREYLRKLMIVAGARNVLYVSTDALIVTDAGYGNLLMGGKVVGENLGCLSLKGKYDDGEIGGQGVYRLGESWTASGLWGRAEQAADGGWNADQWQSLESIVSSKPTGQVMIKNVPVCPPLPRPKGEMLADGWIKPLQIIPTPEVLQLTPAEQRKHYQQLKIAASLET